MSKFTMLAQMARRSVQAVEHVAPKAGYKDAWLVGGSHPHMAARRDFSIRTGVKRAIAASVAGGALVAASTSAEARSKKRQGHSGYVAPPASERQLSNGAGGPTSGSPDAAPISAEEQADPILRGKMDTVRALTAAMNREASSGFGDKSTKAAAALERAQADVSAYKAKKVADAKTAEADAYAKSPMGIATGIAKEYGPYAVGAVIGALLSRSMTKALAKGTTKAVERFENIAKDVAVINKATVGRDIIGSSKGDKMASLLREAFRTAGVKKAPKGAIDPLTLHGTAVLNTGSRAAAQRAKTIAVGDLLHPAAIEAKASKEIKPQQFATKGGQKAMAAEAAATAHAVEADRTMMDGIAKHADHTDAKMFDHKGWGDYALAGTLIGEGVVTRYVMPKYTQDENQKTIMQDIGMSSMAAGAVFLTRRKLASRNPALKPSYHAVAEITAARDRLAREIMHAGRNEARAVERNIEREKAVSTMRMASDKARSEKLKAAVAKKVRQSETNDIKRQAEALFKPKVEAAPGSKAKPVTAPKNAGKKSTQATGHIAAPSSGGKFMGWFR